MGTQLSDYIFAEFGVAGLVLLAIGIAVFKLSSDLAKLRTDLQQQTARDLLNKRFDSYSRLWSHLRPLAIYADDPLTSAKIETLSKKLSDWYFSTDGGLFLTVRCREFYFGLQDVLNGVEDLKRWKCERRPARPEKVFETFVTSLLADKRLSSFTVDHLKRPELIDPEVWRELCRTMAERLRAMGPEQVEELNELVFSAVQQVSSVLRSNLAHELYSRLEVRIPKS
jgi:hypothetical protein